MMASLLQSSSLSLALYQRNLNFSGLVHRSRSPGQTRLFSAVCSQFQQRHARLQSHSQLPHRPLPFRRSLIYRQQSQSFFTKLTRPSPAPITQVTSPSASGEEVQSMHLQEPPLQLTNLPYFVRRTPSNQLPVYLVTKAGGTKRLTKLQKTEGDLEALRSDLARALGLESGDPCEKKSLDVTINGLNGHIIVKGWRKSEIQTFLLDRGF